MLEIVDHFLLDIDWDSKFDCYSTVPHHLQNQRFEDRSGYRWMPVVHYYPFQGASRRDRRENDFREGRSAEKRNAIRMKSSSSVLLGLSAHRAATTGFLRTALRTSRMTYRRRRRSSLRRCGCCSFSINDRTTESGMHASQKKKEKKEEESSFKPTWTNTEKRVWRRRAFVFTFSSLDSNDTKKPDFFEIEKRERARKCRPSSTTQCFLFMCICVWMHTCKVHSERSFFSFCLSFSSVFFSRAKSALWL